MPLHWALTPFVRVLARMSPAGKARVVRAIQESDKDGHVVMCGDGGNDVGALKQVRLGRIRLEKVTVRLGLGRKGQV